MLQNHARHRVWAHFSLEREKQKGKSTESKVVFHAQCFGCCVIVLLLVWLGVRDEVTTCRAIGLPGTIAHHAHSSSVCLAFLQPKPKRCHHALTNADRLLQTTAKTSRMELFGSSIGSLACDRKERCLTLEDAGTRRSSAPPPRARHLAAQLTSGETRNEHEAELLRLKLFPWTVAPDFATT